MCCILSTFPFKPLMRLYGILFCVPGGKQGARSSWLVSKDRQAQGCRLSGVCWPLTVSSYYITLVLWRMFTRATLCGPLSFVCLFSPSTWSGLVFSFVKNNKDIHWETSAGILSGHQSYLFSVINYNSPSPYPHVRGVGGLWWTVSGIWVSSGRFQRTTERFCSRL